MLATAGGAPLAVVPLKALDGAKSRLAGHLTPAERRALTCWMFSRVVAACRGASRVGDVLVVAGDEAGAVLARRNGVDVIVERRPGLAAALATADRAAGQAPATVVVAADLPLATPSAVDAVCLEGAEGPCVVVAPTRDGGTGALLRRPAGVVATAYGPGSADRHLAAAGTAGVHAVRIEIPALSLDVDTAEHLHAAGLRDRSVARWIAGLSVG